MFAPFTRPYFPTSERAVSRADWGAAGSDRGGYYPAKPPVRRNAPEEDQAVVIDIDPHLHVPTPVVTTPEEAIQLAQWLVDHLDDQGLGVHGARAR